MAIAQAPATHRLVVTVLTDSGRTPVPDAEVIATSTSHDIGSRAVTDAAGRTSIDVRRSAPSEIDVRKIGFQPARILIPASAPNDSSIKIILERATPVLDATVITAATLRSKQYHLGASDIEHTTRGIVDALEALQKLRPMMLGDANRLCGKPDKIWINGQRI